VAHRFDKGTRPLEFASEYGQPGDDHNGAGPGDEQQDDADEDDRNSDNGNHQPPCKAQRFQGNPPVVTMQPYPPRETGGVVGASDRGWTALWIRRDRPVDASEIQRFRIRGTHPARSPLACIGE